MIKNENQEVNVVVRALIFEEGELVLTEWKSKRWSFLIGGRIDFGESILTALHREIDEETGATAAVIKLAYFSENIFKNQHGQEFHEYGYYFLVNVDRVICPGGAVIPNPDSPDLIIRRTPINAEGLYNIWPRFLVEYLPRDFANDFADCPRFLYSRNDENGVVESQALAAAFGVASL
ncbi:MAG: NUDIX domain-containing protein [Chloroflexota bacterium]|nr:NUDIX domain-containing protein [Anaerolineales bacterium]MCA9975591.1 NUDIX domain-containing protein [Anaerolineales bacterium]MCB8969097.1 NUDIX domain-containing protein [Ardenticatenaceae bacterium]